MLEDVAAVEMTVAGGGRKCYDFCGRWGFDEAQPGWTDRLLARRPTNVVLVAMANKTARVAWALLRYERIYQPTHA